MATDIQQTIFELEKELNVVKTVAETLEKTMENFKKCPKARITRSHIETRLQCVEKHWDTYNQAYNKIIRNLPKGKKGQIPYIENEEFFKHEEMYIDLKTKLMICLIPKELSTGSSVPFITSDFQEARVMLPKILLPTYSGQYEEWTSFHDLFLTLVHNNKSLNNVQKLHYLKTSLVGEAALILKHIQITESNYEKAWDSLMKRFGNKRITINAIMRRLFSQRKITINSSSLIKNLLDTTFECLHHFNNLNVKTENWDTLIIFMIVQKLDSETHKDLEEHVSSKLDNPDSLPSFDMLQQFLQSRFRTLELKETPKHRPSVIISKERSYHVTSNVEHKKCQMCNENHTLSHCKKFAKFAPVQRSEYIKTNHRCYNCLASGHSVRQCRIPVCCRLCKKRHHTLLHENKENNTTHVDNKPLNNAELVFNTNVDNIEEDDQDITMVASHISTKQSPTALLATALVKVKTDENYTITLRALIDQGSQASFISERAAQLLKAKRYPIKGTVVGVGSSMMDIKHVVYINVQPKSEACNLNIKTYVMSKQLTTKLPSQTIVYNSWPHLQGLVLADPDYYKPSQIDLLLGVDVYASIIQNEIIKGSPGSPCAQKTHLGWILFGTIGSKLPEDTVIVMHHQIVAEDFLKILWEVDQDTKGKYTKEEQKCDTFYENSYKRNSNGRYIVRLPFRSNDLTITDGNTKEISLKRLLLQEKGLLRIPDLQESYDEVLREYLTMGHMEEVPEDEIHNSSVYLPHHAVIRNDKETTKLRVVFDASSKNNNGVSLNDILLIGPGLQDDMRSIIMRWRTHKVCFASDITKMYRMVLLDKRDTDYHRILWRDNTKTSTDKLHSDNFNELAGIKDYRLKTVIFGTACAPYLAIKTLTKLADEEGESYPEAARIIREDFYVDDLASGCDTTEQAICISKQIINILKRGGFDLQKWASNDKEFLKSLDATTVTAKANLDLKLDGIIKALGLTWNLGEDEFRYQLQLEPVSENITKRTILSDLQKLFDPLGWIAPAKVTAKMLVQRLWLEGVGWDQEITTQLKNEWKFIRKDLQNNVNDIRIKRWLNTFNSEKERISLRGFCDASLKVYAAVIYCRIYTRGGEVKTHIVAAKTKVAPVKPVSLPRLELCGATLLAQTYTQGESSHENTST